MAGPAKQKQHKQEKQEQKQARSSDDSSSSRNNTQRSINKYDGNKDPAGHGKGVLDYTRPQDLKNLSDFLGFAGYEVARGVSTNALFQSAHASTQANGCFASRSPVVLSIRLVWWVHINPSSTPPESPPSPATHRFRKITSFYSYQILHWHCTSLCIFDYLSPS